MDTKTQKELLTEFHRLSDRYVKPLSDRKREAKKLNGAIAAEVIKRYIEKCSGKTSNTKGILFLRIIHISTAAEPNGIC